MLKILP